MGLSCCVFCAALTQGEGKQDKLKTESGKFWGAAVADGTRVSRRPVPAAPSPPHFVGDDAHIVAPNRTPHPSPPVIANQPAGWCGNP